jgi:hypothetical protein
MSPTSARIFFLGLIVSFVPQAHGQKLSEKIASTIMAYHLPTHPLSIAAGIRRPSAPSTEWMFNKSDFLQYVAGIRAAAEQIHYSAAILERNRHLTPAEYRRFFAAIKNRLLVQAIDRDLKGQAKQISLAPTAVIYTEYLRELGNKQDPIPTLIAAYIVFGGHAFGARNFLKRGEELGYAEMSRTIGYPGATLSKSRTENNVLTDLAAIIDDIDNRMGVKSQETRHASYMVQLTETFKAQQQTFQKLAGETLVTNSVPETAPGFSSTSSSSSSRRTTSQARIEPSSDWSSTVLYAGGLFLVAALVKLSFTIASAPQS